MAEALLLQRMQAMARTVEVRSAGVDALWNYPADEPARALMLARGLDISPHRAQQVTPDLARWADLILVMESRQRDAMFDIDPTTRGKTYLLGHWIGKEVPDPYMQTADAYMHALSLIEEGLDSWMKKL